MIMNGRHFIPGVGNGPSFYREADKGAGGGTIPPVADPDPALEDTDPLAGLDEKAKAALDKRIADAVTTATETVRKETALQIEKDRKAAERTAAKNKATEEGNHAEVIRLAAEERDAAKAEAEQAKKEAQAVKDENIKIRIAAKHKLPDGWHSRILGDNEAAWEADAAEMAKGLPAHKGPNLEGGQKGLSTKEAQDQGAQKVIQGIASRMI